MSFIIAALGTRGLTFGQRCTKMGVRSSMGSVGEVYDNAMMESFFASRE